MNQIQFNKCNGYRKMSKSELVYKEIQLESWSQENMISSLKSKKVFNTLSHLGAEICRIKNIFQNLSVVITLKTIYWQNVKHTDSVNYLENTVFFI